MVGPLIITLADGRKVTKRQFERMQRARMAQRQRGEQPGRGKIIPHVEKPEEEKYDMTYRSGKSFRLPWDFTQ